MQKLIEMPTKHHTHTRKH